MAAVDVDDDEATADAADLLRSIDAALLVANIMLISCLSFRFKRRVGFSALEMKMAWAYLSKVNGTILST